jgi:hypothetical protein
VKPLLLTKGDHLPTASHWMVSTGLCNCGGFVEEDKTVRLATPQEWDEARRKAAERDADWAQWRAMLARTTLGMP